MFVPFFEPSNKDTGAWSSEGLRAVSFRDGELLCQTSHLTAPRRGFVLFGGLFSSSTSSEEALQNPKCPKRAKRYTLSKRPPAAPEVFGAVLETFLHVLRCSTAAQVFSAEGLQNLSKGTGGGSRRESWDLWESWELGASVWGRLAACASELCRATAPGAQTWRGSSPNFEANRHLARPCCCDHYLQRCLAEQRAVGMVKKVAEALVVSKEKVDAVVEKLVSGRCKSLWMLVF